MNLSITSHGHAGVKASSLLTAVQAKGAGYAISKSEELEVIQEIAEASGRPIFIFLCYAKHNGNAQFGHLIVWLLYLWLAKQSRPS